MAVSYSSSDFHKGWLRLLQNIELAKHHAEPHYLRSGPTLAPNPFLDTLLPSLLFVNLVSLLDEALILYLDTGGLSMPKGYKNSLYYRIKFLGESSFLKNTQDLQDIRDRRNTIAHESSEQADWQELDNALTKIENELQNLGSVGPRPKYEFFAERSKIEESTDPDYAYTQDYCYGLQHNGRKIIELSWSLRYKSVGQS